MKLLRGLMTLVALLFAAPCLAQVTPGTLSPIVIYAAGQSNFVMAPTFSWSPNSAAQVWNNTVGAVGTGTAFVPLSSTAVSLPQKFASDVADANPGHPVYLITSAFSGEAISHWLTGTGAPDGYADGVANVSAALTAVGAAKIDVFLWWQGEADTVSFNTSYAANYATMMSRFWGNSWFPQETPVLIHGLASYADGNNINANANQMNNLLQAVAAADADKRRFVYTSSLHGSTYWQSGANSGHMTGQGYYSAGAMSAGMYLHGPGRNILAGIVTDPSTGHISVGQPAYSPTPYLVNLNSNMTPAAAGSSQFVCPDAQQCFMDIDAFGGFAGYIARAANGTSLAPTTITANQLIATFGVQIYDGTAFSGGNVAAFNCSKTAANASTSDHGTYCSVIATPAGSITTAEAVRFLNGSMLVLGTTSGTGTFTWPAVLGTPTWTLPTGSGTFADSASLPLVLNPTTGALTCPTCTAGSLPTTGLTGTLQAAQEPAHTGDVTNSAGSFALGLATVNSNVGTFGGVNTIPVITANGKGLVTAVTTVTTSEVLTGARGYFVRTDGSDTTCNGQTDASSASAPNCGFLTIAKAMLVAASLNTSAYQLTITVDAGTWTTPVAFPRVVGALPPNLTGVGSTTLISTTGASAITAAGATPWNLANVKLTTSGSGSGIFTSGGSIVNITGGVEWGTIAQFSVFASSYSAVNIAGSDTISGGAQWFMICNAATINNTASFTVSGTPAFSQAFAQANRVGLIISSGTFSGSATGVRYSSLLNSVIDTSGGGANYFPGNSAGSTATGGQYN